MFFKILREIGKVLSALTQNREKFRWRLLWSVLLVISSGGVFLFAQSTSVYFKNFVRHSEGDFCQHLPPLTSFVVYLNGDENRILLENAPRWEPNADPNINGMGVFGVELGNFASPGLQAGDTVHVRFTCQVTQQQGILTAVVSGIPWYYFPTTLTLMPTNFPPPPSDVLLEFTPDGFRKITWNPQNNVTYSVYRHLLHDTVALGQPRRLYSRIASGIVSGTCIDSSGSHRAHGYIVLPVRSGVYGPHSQEVKDYPPAPVEVNAAVTSTQPLTVAVTYHFPGDTTGMQFRIYRDTTAAVPLDSLHRVGSVAGLAFLDSSVVLGRVYYYRVAAVNSFGVEGLWSSVARVVAEPFAGGKPDLDVLYISRSPRYPRFQVVYDPPGYNPHLQPGTQFLQHYPLNGENLKYTAVIRNSGGGTSGGFTVEWWVDSTRIQTQHFSELFPGQKVISRFTWPYDSLHPNMIECRAVADSSITEVTESNNQIAIRSNGLSFHFYVEDSLRHLFETHENPWGSYSFEDWAQFELQKMRQFFRQAVYPTTTSQGVTEFVFLDTVTYHPNGTLPAYGTHALPSELWDGQWGFLGDEASLNYFQNIVLNQNNGVDWALLHELGHQLGLIDLYNMDVQESELQVIEPRTGQKPPLTPVAWDVLHYCSRHNYLMHSNFQAGFSDHSAGALQRNCGKRRGFFGEYLADVPAENSLLLRNSSGKPVRNAEIRVYQMQDNIIPNTVKFSGATDAEGRYVFPHVTDTSYFGGISVNHPFSSNFSQNPHVVGTNAVLFVRLAKGDSVGYGFIDICDFNVAYWSGDSLSATYVLPVTQWFQISPGAIEQSQAEVPVRTELIGSFPNPFNPRTWIVFGLHEKSSVHLEIYNIAGERVRVLAHRVFLPGHYRIRWNGTNDAGVSLPSGVYFARLKTDHYQKALKLILLK